MPSDLDASALQAQRAQIRSEIRKARQSRSMSQEQLGDAIGVSRFVINRLERGALDLRPDIAGRIEQALGVEGLVVMVEQRDGLADTDEVRSDRDLVMRRLLRTPRIQRVRVVLMDDLDLHELIADNDQVADARVEVIVPTQARERQLFVGDLPIYGHVENQVRRMSELTDGRSTGGIGTIEVFESTAPLFPCALVRSPAGIECAYWPAAPRNGRFEGEALPAVSSMDLQVTSRIEAHIEAVRTSATRIRKNEALVVVDPVPRPEGDNRPVILTRFASLGGDAEYEMSEDEALAVAIVLVHAVCPRPGMGIARRVVLTKRAAELTGQTIWSFNSHSVDELDVRRSRLVSEGANAADLSRSTIDPLAAALQHGAYLSGPDGIPDDVFRQAASRGLFAAFGLEVAVERLQNVVLPPELQKISKAPDEDLGQRPTVRRIVPRFFTLELAALQDAESTPELRRISDRADVVEWGTQDIAEHDDLNDFLLDAKRTGFLAKVMADLGVAAR